MTLKVTHDFGIVEDPIARVPKDARAAPQRLRHLRIGIDAERGRVSARQRERAPAADPDLEIRTRAAPAVNLAKARQVGCRQHRASWYSGRANLVLDCRSNAVRPPR